MSSKKHITTGAFNEAKAKICQYQYDAVDQLNKQINAKLTFYTVVNPHFANSIGMTDFTEAGYQDLITLLGQSSNVENLLPFLLNSSLRDMICRYFYAKYPTEQAPGYRQPLIQHDVTVTYGPLAQVLKSLDKVLAQRMRMNEKLTLAAQLLNDTQSETLIRAADAANAEELLTILDGFKHWLKTWMKTTTTAVITAADEKTWDKLINKK
jgi:hypothetical protein